MSSQDIIKAIKELSANVAKLNAKLDESEIANRTMLEMRWKEVSQKFDIFANLNEQSAAQISEASNTAKRPSRPTFFKQIFLENQDLYLDQLYTKEEIDLYMEHPEVKKKAKEADKYKKIAALIYENHIKINQPEGRQASFESVFTEHYG